MTNYKSLSPSCRFGREVRSEHKQSLETSLCQMWTDRAVHLWLPFRTTAITSSEKGPWDDRRASSQVQKVEQTHMNTVGVKECIEFCTYASTSIISDATFERYTAHLPDATGNTFDISQPWLETNWNTSTCHYLNLSGAWGYAMMMVWPR